MQSDSPLDPRQFLDSLSGRFAWMQSNESDKAWYDRSSERMQEFMRATPPVGLYWLLGHDKSKGHLCQIVSMREPTDETKPIICTVEIRSVFGEKYDRREEGITADRLVLATHAEAQADPRWAMMDEN